jgi:hypothetical protein
VARRLAEPMVGGGASLEARSPAHSHGRQTAARCLSPDDRAFALGLLECCNRRRHRLEHVAHSGQPLVQVGQRGGGAPVTLLEPVGGVGLLKPLEEGDVVVVDDGVGERLDQTDEAPLIEQARARLGDSGCGRRELSGRVDADGGLTARRPATRRLVDVRSRGLLSCASVPSGTEYTQATRRGQPTVDIPMGLVQCAPQVSQSVD